MRGAKRSAKNTAKNISLLVLCGLMGVLCAVNWLMGLNIAQMPADSALRRLHDRFVGGAVGYEIRSSAAFFAPEMVTSPFSVLPPLITYFVNLPTPH